MDIKIGRDGEGERERERERGHTYIFSDNRSKARTPQNPLSTDFVHKQALTTEHGLAEALALVLGDNSLGAGEKRVFATAPCVIATELDDGDVADCARREEQFARTGVVRLGHVTAGQGFFKGEFHSAFQRYSGRHCYHSACVTY